MFKILKKVEFRPEENKKTAEGYYSAFRKKD